MTKVSWRLYWLLSPRSNTPYRPPAPNGAAAVLSDSFACSEMKQPDRRNESEATRRIAIECWTLAMSTQLRSGNFAAGIFYNIQAERCSPICVSPSCDRVIVNEIVPRRRRFLYPDLHKSASKVRLFTPRPRGR